MKISGDRLSPAVDSPAAAPVSSDHPPVQTTAPVAGTDTVALSPDAALLAAATRAAQAEPAVREELVEKMRKEIADKGGLSVDPHELADLMIDDLLDK
jgi:flagellar biosynthesis anti-sigma factor FlgM